MDLLSPGAWLELSVPEVLALLDWHRSQFLSDGVYGLLDSDLAARIADLLPM